MKLIHYGAKAFKPSYFLPIKNANWQKPEGGLWTSPIDSEYGWKDWCLAEGFRECVEENSFTLELKETARICIIDSLEDLIALPTYKSGKYYKEFLDFELIAQSYDAILLTAEGQWKTRMTKPNLYGWDCETVLILNSKIIKL